MIARQVTGMIMGGRLVLNGHGRSASQTVLLVRHLHRPFTSRGPLLGDQAPRVQEYTCSMHYEVGTWEAATRHMSYCFETDRYDAAGAP